MARTNTRKNTTRLDLNLFYRSSRHFLLLCLITVLCWRLQKVLGSGEKTRVKVLVSDKIMNKRTYAYPIVLEDYKLIFFPIQKTGCTVWKQLFRRASGFQDWRTGRTWGQKTGLIYLADYSVKQATDLMNDEAFTRAVFLRDPKEKFLSAYLDKAVKTRYFYQKCLKACRRVQDRSTCLQKSKKFDYFVQATRSGKCYDTHWSPQSENIEKKYLNTLDFVGHLESGAHDARVLLEKLGMWEKFGRNGWGKHGNESIFESRSYVKHKTTTESESDLFRLRKWYTTSIEREIENRFSEDYEREIYSLERKRIWL